MFVHLCRVTGRFRNQVAGFLFFWKLEAAKSIFLTRQFSMLIRIGSSGTKETQFSSVLDFSKGVWWPFKTICISSLHFRIVTNYIIMRAVSSIASKCTMFYHMFWTIDQLQKPQWKQVFHLTLLKNDLLHHSVLIAHRSHVHTVVGWNSFYFCF